MKDTRIVGPFLPSPANPLPDELEQFMQNAGDEGIILVSFGSTLEDLVGLEETLLHMIAETFSKVPQKVIWKLKSVGKFTEFLKIRTLKSTDELARQLKLMMLMFLASCPWSTGYINRASVYLQVGVC